MEVFIKTCYVIDAHQKSIICYVLGQTPDTNQPKK